jgi:hypothetical protein
MRSSGELDMGNNVAFARPESPAAGYRPAHLDSSGILKLAGSTADGYLTYRIVDPSKIRDGHTYRITFEDTANLKTRLTTNYTLKDVTSGEVKVDGGKYFNDGDVTPFVDGFTLTFHDNPEELILNSDLSGWDVPGIYPLSVVPYRREPVELLPGDYQLIIGDVGIDTSSVFDLGAAVLPAIPVNFTLRNTTLNKRVDFAFRERDMLEGMEGVFTAATSGLRTDEIIVLKDSLTASWHITLRRTEADTFPQVGAVANVVFDKPFLSNDRFEFTIHGARIDENLAQNQMDKIKVVPNPYIVTNLWEPQNPYSTGRGPREIHFTHLPAKCTIKIFNVRGQLVQILEHDTPLLEDGTEIWDMKTLDQLEIGYGAYIFHVDAAELGEKIGKFAVIK